MSEFRISTEIFRINNKQNGLNSFMSATQNSSDPIGTQNVELSSKVFVVVDEIVF